MAKKKTTTSASWYSGTQPTLGETYARIAAVAQQDYKKGVKAMNMLQRLQSDPTSIYYNPYTQASNRSVSNLRSYGVDTSKIDDDFFQKNNYLLKYLRYNGTTNHPSKPGVNASTAEKAAYEYWQILDSEDATRRAEDQWSHLQYDIYSMVNQKNRNYSDDEILSMIDWSKYGELTAMDEGKAKYNPKKYNRAIGYSQDALKGVIWAARNPDFSGSIDGAITNSYLGIGNQWKADPNIDPKRLSGDKETFDPYSLGSTMDKQLRYFGVDNFSWDWVNSNRQEIMNSGNETAIKYFGDVVDALYYTDGLKESLDALHNEIDTWIDWRKPEDLIAQIKGNDSYKNLFDLDRSLETTKLKDTAYAINYRMADIEKEIYDRYAQRAAMQDVAGMATDYFGNVVGNALGIKKEEGPVEQDTPTAPVLSETETAIEESTQEDYSEIAPTINRTGTESEKNAFATGKTSIFEKVVDMFANAAKDAYSENLYTSVKSRVENDYPKSIRTISDYESHQTQKDAYTAELDEVSKELSGLNERYSHMQSFSDMSPGEYQNFWNLVENKDKDWHYIEEILEKGDNEEDSTQHQDYNLALAYLYNAIRPDDFVSDADSIRSLATQWWELYKQVNRENAPSVDRYTGLNEEEFERREILTKSKAELEAKINAEDEYLTANQSTYESAKMDKNAILSSVGFQNGIGENVSTELINDIDTVFNVISTPFSKDMMFLPGSYYDLQAQNGTITKEEAVTNSTVSAVNCANMLASIDKSVAAMEAAGITLTDEERKVLETNRAVYEKWSRSFAYASMDGDENFEQSAAAGEAKAKSGEYGRIAKAVANGKWGVGEFDALDWITGLLGGQEAFLKGGQKDELIKSMSDDEKRRFFYLLENDGQQAAEDYFNFISDPQNGELTVRASGDVAERAQDTASKNFFSALLTSVSSFIGKQIGSAYATEYRILSGLTGQDASAYNPAFWMSNATSGMRKGAKEHLQKIFGDSGVSDKVYDVIMGLGDIALASGEMKALGSQELAKGFGKLVANIFGKVEKFAKVGEAAGKIAATTVADVSSVLPLSIDAWNNTYQNVYMKTKDADKANQMAGIALIGDLVSHAVIMKGLHRTFNSNPSEYTSILSKFMYQSITNAATASASTFATDAFTKIAEKSILDGMSEWDQVYQKYKGLHYPDSLAEQYADKETWESIWKHTIDAGVNSLIRTGITFAYNEAIHSETAQKAMRKMDSLWEDIKSKAEAVGAKIKGTYTEVENAEGYTLFNSLVDIPDNLKGKVPDNAIVNPFGKDGTTVYDRTNGKPHKIVALFTKDDNNLVYFVDDQGEQIPWAKVATQHGKPADNLTQDEFDLVGFGWNYGKSAYNQNQTSASPDVVQESPAKNDTDGKTKALSIINTIGDSDRTASAVGVAAVLGDDDPNVSKAAGQTIVSDIAGGDTKAVAALLTGLVSNTPNLTQTTSDLVMSSLTNGAGNEALRNIIGKLKAGEQITADDVAALHNGVQKDHDADPKGQQASLDAAVKENRIANRTNQIASKNKNKIRPHVDKVAAADRNVSEKKKDLSDANDALEAAKQNALDAADNALSKKGKKSTLGNLQQTWNHVPAVDESVSAAEKKVAEAEQEARDARSALESAENDFMMENRLQAQDEIEQEDQNAAVVAQQRYDEAVANVTPLAPFGHSIKVKDSEGKTVRITGVYDRFDAGDTVSQGNDIGTGVDREGFNYGQQYTVEIYTTDDGRLVMNAYKLDRYGDPIRQQGDVDTSDFPEVADASDKLIGNNANGSDSIHPEIRPAVYFPASFPININGKEVQMIGLAGYENLDDETSPVIMGLDGNKYSLDDPLIEQQIPSNTSGKVIMDAFFDNEDSLEEIPSNEIKRLQEVNTNVGAQEPVQSAEETAPGDEGEGNNEGQLLPTSGRDDGSADNGNVGLESGEGVHEPAEESVPGRNGQDKSGVSERLLSKSTRNKLGRKGVTSTGLHEETDPQRFSSNLDAARENNKYKMFVDPQSPADLEEKGAIMLTSKDGLIMGAVGTKGIYNGDIFAVCKSPESKAANASRSIIIHAIAQGGKKLDCYNGTEKNAGLPRMYSSVGMIPVARVAFNDDFHKDDGWDYERDGRPDVIFWMLKPGEDAESIVDKYGKTEDKGGFHLYTMEELANLPLFEDTVGVDENGKSVVTEYGYDKAWAYRDSVLNGEQPIPDVITPTNVNAPSEEPAPVENPENLNGDQTTPTNVNNEPSGLPEPVKQKGLPEPEASAESTPANVNLPESRNVPPNTPTNPPPETPKNPEIGQRQWGREGAQKSDILSDKTKKRLLNNNSYLKDHNEEQLNRALEWIKSHATENDPTGLYGSVREFDSEDFNLLNKDGQVRLMAAITMAAEMGDQETEARLSDNLFNRTGTDLGQAMQARKIWMTMTPQGRKISLRREADRIQKAYEDKGKNLRFAEGQRRFEISDEVLDAAANAETPEEFEAARRKMELEIARQIPSDMQLRLRTFRMTSMLANPRTHIRNMAGNFTGLLMVESKNAKGVALEHVLGVDKNKRTKAITRDKDATDFAKKDFEKMKDTVQGTGKYLELSEVERNRKAFGSGQGKTALGRLISRTVGKGYQKVADASSSALEREDVVFLKYHYTRALSGFMTARGLKPSDMKGKVLDEARAYAVSEAQKATYRSPNELATWLNEIQLKPVRKLIDAVQPFVKTPANIVKMGIEYSPAGLARTLTTGINHVKKYQEWEKKGFKGKKPNGAWSPQEAVDKLASGITGTAIAGIGAWLFSQGILKVKATDTEKRDNRQDYSLEINGQSYGIGNLVPFNIPLMLGATIYENLTNKENPIEGFKEGNYGKGAREVFAKTLNALKDIAEPVVDTTMMSSLNSLLNVNSYSSGDLTLGTLGEKVVANYISSYFPSAIGAAAKVIDPVQRKAYTEAGDELSIWDSMIEQVQNKFPFLSLHNVPYINAWGEENISPDNVKPMDYFNAFLQNFVYPDKIQEIKDTELDDMLAKLSTDAATNVEPKTVKSISVNGKNVRLNDKQWYMYNKLCGSESKKQLQELVERPEFIAFAGVPEVQAELVKKVYKYAKAKAELSVFPESEIKDSWTKGALEAANQGKLIDYIFEKEEASAKEKSNDAHRESLYASIKEGNFDAAKMDMNYLIQGGVKKENIKSSVTRQIKPLYKELYENGYKDDLYRLETMLIGLDLGYTYTTFAGWIK